MDERFAPYPDQWEFLSTIRRISRREVEEIVRLAEAKGKVIGVRLAPAEDEDEAAPWLTPPSRRRREASIPGPLPESLELTLGSQIYIRKEGLAPALRNRLIQMAAFQNPEFYRVAMGLRPTHRNESHKRRRPRVSGDPRQVDSRFRGNDVTFERAQAMRLATYDKPRIIACAEDHPQHLGLPRGCLEELLQTLSDLNIQPWLAHSGAVRVAKP